jgi:hypothetical protein
VRRATRAGAFDGEQGQLFGVLRPGQVAEHRDVERPGWRQGADHQRHRRRGQWLGGSGTPVTLPPWPIGHTSRGLLELGLTLNGRSPHAPSPHEHRGEYGYGDVWTWTAICSDTKLVPSWLVGERTAFDAEVFMRDLASRLVNRVQLTTDGNSTYLNAVDTAFGSDIDYAMLHKIYDAPEGVENERRYSPAICTGIDLRVVQGKPNLAKASTSCVERQNLYADGYAPVHPAHQRFP